jgi:hypothetical protein
MLGYISSASEMISSGLCMSRSARMRDYVVLCPSVPRDLLCAGCVVFRWSACHLVPGDDVYVHGVVSTCHAIVQIIVHGGYIGSRF